MASIFAGNERWHQSHRTTSLAMTGRGHTGGPFFAPPDATMTVDRVNIEHEARPPESP